MLQKYDSKWHVVRDTMIRVLGKWYKIKLRLIKIEGKWYRCN